MHHIINPSAFGTKQRTSFLDVTTAFEGVKVWFSEPSGKLAGRAPVLCSILDEKLIVYYGTAVEVRKKIDGSLLWSREFMNRAEDHLDAEHFSIMDANSFLSVISWENVDLRRTLLPILSNYAYLLDWWSMGNETVLIYTISSGPVSGPGDVTESPGYEITVTDLNSGSVAMRVRDNITPVGYARRADQKEYFIGTSNYLLRVPGVARQVSQFTKIEFKDLRQFSIDDQGAVFAVFSEKELNYLGKFGANNKEEWRTRISGLSENEQPPAVSKNGTVYYMSGRDLNCIKDGIIIWSKEMDVRPGQTLLSVLGDESVLVSSYNSLTHISSDGETEKRIELIFPITCRPVVDKDGLCFIAGSDGILCYR